MPYKRSVYRFANVGAGQKKWDDVEVTTEMYESYFASVSNKFIAVALRSSGGAGCAGVYDLTKPGRHTVDFPKITGHVGAIVDLQFAPYDDNLLVTIGETGSVLSWRIPDGGLTGDLSVPEQEFKAHTKRVSCIEFHPSCREIFATCSFDKTLIIWRTNAPDPVLQVRLDDHVPLNFSWSWDGRSIAVLTKENIILSVDHFTGAIAKSVNLSDTVFKMSRIISCGSTGHFCISGFSAASSRQINFVNTEFSSVSTFDIPHSSSILLPFWDENSKICSLLGRGSSELYTYSYDTAAAKFEQCFKLLIDTPCKSYAMLPTRNVNAKASEVLRVFGLGKKAVLSYSIFVQAKKEYMYQYYNTCISTSPSVALEEFLRGESRPPTLIDFVQYIYQKVEKTVESSEAVTKFYESNPQSMQKLVALDQADGKPEEPAAAERPPALDADDRHLLTTMERRVRTLEERVADLEADNKVLKEKLLAQHL